MIKISQFIEFTNPVEVSPYILNVECSFLCISLVWLLYALKYRTTTAARYFWPLVCTGALLETFSLYYYRVHAYPAISVLKFVDDKAPSFCFTMYIVISYTAVAIVIDLFRVRNVLFQAVFAGFLTVWLDLSFDTVGVLDTGGVSWWKWNLDPSSNLSEVGFDVLMYQVPVTSFLFWFLFSFTFVLVAGLLRVGSGAIGWFSWMGRFLLSISLTPLLTLVLFTPFHIWRDFGISAEMSLFVTFMMYPLLPFVLPRIRTDFVTPSCFHWCRACAMFAIFAIWACVEINVYYHITDASPVYPYWKDLVIMSCITMFLLWIQVLQAREVAHLVFSASTPRATPRTGTRRASASRLPSGFKLKSL